MVIVVIAAIFFGVDPSALLTGGGGQPPQYQEPGQQGQDRPRSAAKDELAEFVSVVLATTEDTWKARFPVEFGGNYVEPALVLFSGQIASACGAASGAMGPFYCPADRKIYIDLSFYEDLRNRFRAPGDFAQAYVIAHEVGHHIQTLLGITQQVNQMRGQIGKAAYNRLSVKLELQADCLAGIWAHHTEKAQRILEDGDIEEALTAASAIGDDRIQRQSQGYAVPDSFTHGTSEQRTRWFIAGIKSGTFESCNTFEASQL